MTRTDIDETPTSDRPPSGGEPDRYDLDGSSERTKVREGFVWHVGTYVIMMGFFVAIAWASGSGYRWIIWVAIPWGLGLAFHALAFLVEGTRLVRRR